MRKMEHKLNQKKNNKKIFFPIPKPQSPSLIFTQVYKHIGDLNFGRLVIFWEGKKNGGNKENEKMMK